MLRGHRLKWLWRSVHRVGAVDRGTRHTVIGALIMMAVLASSMPAPIAYAQDATPGRGDVASLLPVAESLPTVQPRDGGSLRVTTTTGILADLMLQIGGERVEVRSMLPANADPHDFDPKPENLVDLTDADLIVRHGLELDPWADGLLDNAGATAPVVVATEGLQTLASDEDEFAAGDPHVWFDPTNVETMIGTLQQALTHVDPDGASTYATRSDAYRAQVRTLDQAIVQAVATIPEERRKLVTNHDALGYYANRYGLTIVGTVIPSLDTRAEPGAADIAELLATIEREQVPAIFAESMTSSDLADQLADEAGVTIVDNLYTDSLGDAGSGADTYHGLMRTDTILIVEALR